MAGLNQKEILVLLDGQDRTAELDSLTEGEEYCSYTFRQDPEKVFSKLSSSVIVIRNPDELDPALYKLEWNGTEIAHLNLLLRFRKGRFVYYVFEKDEVLYSASESEVTLHASCLEDPKAAECFSYLKDLAKADKQSYDDEPPVWSRYERLDFIDEDSLLSYYLNPEGKSLDKRQQGELIFPFGGNNGQFRAVRTALENQLTVIQGPPGTGKTQTILNLAANLLMQKKTMLIISQTPESIKSKLERCGLGYLAAVLGSEVNKQYFLQNQPPYPERKVSALSADPLRIKALRKKLEEVFQQEEELARMKQLMREGEEEIRYFEEYCRDNGIKVEDFQSQLDDPEKILDLIAWLLTIPNDSRLKLLMFRLCCHLPLSLTSKKKPAEILTLLKDRLYKVKRESFSKSIAKLEAQLSDTSSEKLLKELALRSEGRLRSVLDKPAAKERPVFTSEDLRKNGKEFLKEYPVVLSTSFSATTSLKHVKYDYLIMDEASEISIAAGALALSVAANAVILGDDRSFAESSPEAEEIFSRYSLDERYHEKSFLSSVSQLVPPDCRTLLKENYRSAPLLVTYSNRKFYNGELLAMSPQRKDPIEIRFVEKLPGEGEINSRECEVILSKVLPSLYNIKDEDIGIITPYRKQADFIKARLEDRAIEVSTAHRFRGKEKRVVIYSAVDAQLKPGETDELFILALSRAKDKFVLTVSAKEGKGNIKDFLDYAAYIKGQIGDNRLYAVFDLLYGRNVETRREILRDQLRISEYDTETSAYTLLSGLLSESFPSVKMVCHYPLRELVRHPDRNRLGDEKYAYVTNHLTHLDFLLYHRLSKKPLLAVEVEGYDFHDLSSKKGLDRLKDEILAEYSLPLIRIRLHDKDVKDKLRKALSEAL